MYDNIGVYDWQTILGLVETVAWVAIVAIGVMFLMQSKSKLLTKQNKKIVWLIFAIWAIAYIGLAVLNTYSYASTTRENFVQSIESQRLQYEQ